MKIVSDLSIKFSYWILLWFLLFMVGFFPYNPFLALCIALSFNICVLLILFYKKYIYKAILYFIAMLLLKVVPLLILINYNQTAINYIDIKVSIILVFIYLVYIVFIQKKSIYKIYNETNNNRIKTPLMSLFNNKKYLKQ